ncbi:NADP-dependent oxidoreductase, partial [Nonomuraea fuscirosea]
MKAIIYRDHGDADVLQLVERDVPEPGPGEVRVRVAVSGVNPTDWKSRSGATSRKSFPEVTPHLDGAGVIDAVGLRPRHGDRRGDGRRLRAGHHPQQRRAPALPAG